MFNRKIRPSQTIIFSLIGAMIQGVCSLSSTIIKPMQKQHLLFFPARFQQPVPREMYGNFISKLSDNYEVHIASSNPTENDEFLKKLTQKSGYDNEVGLISHSSGVADLWNTYSSLTHVDIDKIILIEPLDLQKGIRSPSLPSGGLWDKFNLNISEKLMGIDKLNDKIEQIVETDYLELVKYNVWGRFRSQEKTESVDDSHDGEHEGDECVVQDETMISRERGNMLVVKHKQSDKWKFIPTVPPLSLLNADLMNFQDFMNIDEVLIDKFSHFDILDRPWANLMNRASLRNNKDQQELDEYLNLLDDIVVKLMS